MIDLDIPILRQILQTYRSPLYRNCLTYFMDMENNYLEPFYPRPNGQLNDILCLVCNNRQTGNICWMCGYDETTDIQRLRTILEENYIPPSHFPIRRIIIMEDLESFTPHQQGIIAAILGIQEINTMSQEILLEEILMTSRLSFEWNLINDM